MRYLTALIACLLLTPAVSEAQELGRLPLPPTEIEAVQPRSFVFQMAEIRTAAAAPNGLSAADVLKWLEEAEKTGQIEFLETVRMTVVEDQKSLAQFGRSVAVVTGESQTAGGRTKSWERREFGTIVNLAAKAIGGKVDVELSYNSARPGEGTDGDPAEMITMQVKTRLIVEPGKPTLVTAKSAKAATYLVLVLEK